MGLLLPSRAVGFFLCLPESLVSHLWASFFSYLYYWGDNTIFFLLWKKISNLYLISPSPSLLMPFKGPYQKCTSAQRSWKLARHELEYRKLEFSSGIPWPTAYIMGDEWIMFNTIKKHFSGSISRLCKLWDGSQSSAAQILSIQSQVGEWNLAFTHLAWFSILGWNLPCAYI